MYNGIISLLGIWDPTLVAVCVTDCNQIVLAAALEALDDVDVDSEG